MAGTMSFTIVTGLSGAGKTQAMKALEDLDYFCIDNLPPLLLPKLVEVHAQGDESRDVAVAMDVRGRGHFHNLFQALEWLEQQGYHHRILFLDCADLVLIRRFSETRRRHPLSEAASIQDSIDLERRLLADVRQRADIIVDTTASNPGELKGRLNEVLVGLPLHKLLAVDMLSFGFKYGVPTDADIIFDVRFLPNPFYIRELSGQTGLASAVAEYVLRWPQTEEFLEKFYSLLTGLIPAYSQEGKARLTVGIGCTGGKHRSVAIGEELARRLQEGGKTCRVRHRELRTM